MSYRYLSGSSAILMSTDRQVNEKALIPEGIGSIKSNISIGNFFSFLNQFVRTELNAVKHAVEDDIDNDDDFHNRKPSDIETEHKSVLIERKGGLANRFVLFLLLLWYLFSALTLYTNKYIVATRKLDPTLVGTVQMIVTSFFGYIQLKHTQWTHSSDILSHIKSNNQHYRTVVFWRNMFIIGTLRLFSIVLGLMALKQATVSFVETVKSSSPLFTVIVSRFLIGEITGFWTNVSLFPIMIGLALCSSFELNFSIFGFLAAITTNITEWPLEVQFFSSTASMIALVPISYLTVTFNEQTFQPTSIILFFINGLSFHAQTLLAFTLMSYISPVTYRFSVYIFKNQVGYMSAFGTLFVIVGVLLFNHAKNVDQKSGKDHQVHKV